jgi:hypothetical protein
LERRQAENLEGKEYAQDVAKDPIEVSEWEDEIAQTQGKIDRQKEEIARREAASGEGAVSGEGASGEEAAYGGEVPDGGTGSNESGSWWDSEKIWEWIKDIIPFSILVNNLFLPVYWVSLGLTGFVVYISLLLRFVNAKIYRLRLLLLLFIEKMTNFSFNISLGLPQSIADVKFLLYCHNLLAWSPFLLTSSDGASKDPNSNPPTPGNESELGEFGSEGPAESDNEYPSTLTRAKD